MQCAMWWAAQRSPARRAGRRTGRGDCSDHTMLVRARRLVVRSRTRPARPSQFPSRHPVVEVAVPSWLARWEPGRSSEGALAACRPHAHPQRWRLRQRWLWLRWQAAHEGLFAVVSGSGKYGRLVIWRWTVKLPPRRRDNRRRGGVARLRCGRAAPLRCEGGKIGGTQGWQRRRQW